MAKLQKKQEPKQDEQVINPETGAGPSAETGAGPTVEGELPKVVKVAIMKYINSYESSLQHIHTKNVTEEHLTIDFAKELYKNLTAFYPAEYNGLVAYHVLREYFKVYDEKFHNSVTPQTDHGLNMSFGA